MREFVVIFLVAVCLVGACIYDVKNNRVWDKGYPREVYHDPDLGSIVMIDDSIAVVFIRKGLNTSLSSVVNIKDINRKIRGGTAMNRDEILDEVNSFLSMRYFKQVEVSEEDMAHFVNLMADCAEFVLEKYKNRMQEE